MNDMPFGGKTSNWTDYKTAKIILFRVPYDSTATWQKGAGLDPEAIVEASAHVELYDVERDKEVHRGKLERLLQEKIPEVNRGSSDTF